MVVFLHKIKSIGCSKKCSVVKFSSVKMCTPVIKKKWSSAVFRCFVENFSFLT